MKLKEGKIIDKMKLDDGREITLRYPKRSDLRPACDFYNRVIKETEFLSRVTPVSKKEETVWLNSTMNKIKKGNMVQFIAECDGEIVGSASVERKSEQRGSHVGVFGICIRQKFTGLGIGKFMMVNIEKEARKMNLRVIELSVHGTNKIAKDLYKKMGFKYAGEVPGAVKTKDGFDSDVRMYKVLK